MTVKKAKELLHPGDYVYIPQGKKIQRAKVIKVEADHLVTDLDNLFYDEVADLWFLTVWGAVNALGKRGGGQQCLNDSRRGLPNGLNGRMPKRGQMNIIRHGFRSPQRARAKKPGRSIRKRFWKLTGGVMMREILFRGKRLDNCEWVEGYLLKECNYATCSWNLGIEYKTDRFGRFAYEVAEVVPYTVGQFTGLTDKNGKKVFEGDILHQYSPYRKEYWGECVVKYGEFNCSCCDGVYGWYFDGGDIRDVEFYEVCGNIHDNPGLLGGAEDG